MSAVSCDLAYQEKINNLTASLFGWARAWIVRRLDHNCNGSAELDLLGLPDAVFVSSRLSYHHVGHLRIRLFGSYDYFGGSEVRFFKDQVLSFGADNIRKVVEYELFGLQFLILNWSNAGRTERRYLGRVGFLEFLLALIILKTVCYELLCVLVIVLLK